MMYGFLKRFFDIFLSLIALVILSPIYLIACLGIFVSSPGPIFYKANRIGKDRKLFTMYKFRTMRLNSEKGHLITLRSDDRIFPFGKFLRKSKIDELPQLVNIIMGDMSIVGWRPEDEENADAVFNGKYIEVLAAKPGLTSPGSLYDYTHGEKYDSEEAYTKEFMPIKMELELYYVRNCSLFYDVQLIIRTITTIIGIVFGKKSFEPPVEIKRISNT